MRPDSNRTTRGFFDSKQQLRPRLPWFRVRDSLMPGIAILMPNHLGSRDATAARFGGFTAWSNQA